MYIYIYIFTLVISLKLQGVEAYTSLQYLDSPARNPPSSTPMDVETPTSRTKEMREMENQYQVIRVSLDNLWTWLAYVGMSFQL